LARESNGFVGREEEQTRLTELLGENRGCVTVLGPTGVGKSRLLRHWATGHFAAGTYTRVCWCDLTTAYSEEDILHVVETSIEVEKWQEEEGMSDHVDAIGTAIAALGNTLIVLDNAEQIVDSLAKCLQRWWSLAPEARFLVTSQVPLGLPGEQRFQLSPLSFQGQSVEDNPSLALFLDRAASVQPDFECTGESLQAVLDILSALDGLPLAIELAASRIRHFPPVALRDRLEEQFKLLRQPKNAGPKRHMSLKAGLDWSWELLPPWEQAALAQCSAFCSGFDWEAVEAVVDLSQWAEAPWALDVVASLVDKSLIAIRELPGGAVRLSMLNTIGLYASDRLKEMGASEVAGTAHRHADHYAGLGRLHCGIAHGSLAATRYLYIELANLRAAIQRGLEHGWSNQATCCAIAVLKIVRMTGPYGPSVELAKRVLQSSSEPEDRTRLLELLGLVCRLMGRINDAERYLLEALTIRRDIGGAAGEGVVLGNLGYLSLNLGHLETARSYFEQALRLCRDSDELSNAAAAMNGLAAVTARLGQMKEAKEIFHQSLTLARSQKSRHGEAASHSNLGRMCTYLEEYSIALRHFNLALDMFEEVQARQSQSLALTGLANLHHTMKNYMEAVDCWQKALTIQREVGVRVDEGRSLSGLGKSLMAAGKLDEAKDAMEASELLLRAGKSPDPLARLLCRRGLLECQLNQFQTAQNTLAEVEDLIAEFTVEPDVWLAQDIEDLKQSLLGAS